MNNQNYFRMVDSSERVIDVEKEAKEHNARVWVNTELESTVISTSPVFNHVLYTQGDH